MSLWNEGEPSLETTAQNHHVTSERYGIVVSTSASYTGRLRFQSWPQTAVPDGDFVDFLSFSRIFILSYSGL